MDTIQKGIYLACAFIGVVMLVWIEIDTTHIAASLAIIASSIK